MYKRIVSEIGSEYWEPEKQGDAKYLLTGRTALEFIIRDILAEHDIKSVLMPSYCCHTMIMPFVLHGIDVRFYDVFYDGRLRVELPESKQNEICFLIRYFGYEKLIGLENVRKNWEVIIEDQTHSWINGTESEADYTFVSYKKWFEVAGIARAAKRNGKFINAPFADNEDFSKLREKAFGLKKKYIESGVGDKAEFLGLFDEAEKIIEDDYCNYRPSSRAFQQLLELNKEEICSIRRNNAEFLINELKKIPHITVVFDHIGKKDVPLFVPILVRQRDELRRYLIEKGIYLPAHWPLSDYHAGISERARKLYDQELSVVCDQRYEIEDMNRIIIAIQDFF